MKALSFFTPMVLVVASSLSFAESIDQRQQNQEQRIKRGIASGELTVREANRLIVQQRDIAATEARFKADGKFTRQERAKVQHKQDKANARIFQQKHDVQDRN